jgi:hypothetical protein
MGLEFLVNPRAAPRARVRCRYKARSGAAAFEGFTEDLGPHGCQLIAPASVPRSVLIHLGIQLPTLEQAQVAGTVAWVSPQAPWRVGVAFEERSRREATRLFDAIVAVQPGLAAWRQVPDRISLDAMVWLAPPPKLLVDFNADEVAVLTAVGTGATVFELKSRLRGRWAQAERAFFSLLASRHLTLSRGGAVPFANWAELLHQLQAEVAAASLSDEPDPLPAPPPRPASQASPVPAPPPRSAPASGPERAPFQFTSGDASGGMDIDPEALELDLGPGQAQGARGVVPGPAARARSAEAEEAWQQALQALAEGHTVAATALLRAAMALAPGDPEIAKAFGEVTAGRR